MIVLSSNGENKLGKSDKIILQSIHDFFAPICLEYEKR